MNYFNFVIVSVPCKTNRPSFWIILKLSDALVCSVFYLDRMVININALKLYVFEWSIAEGNFFIYMFIVSCNSLIWLLSDLVSSEGFSLAWHTQIIFSIDPAKASSRVLLLVNTYFLNFRLALYWFCLLIVLRALVRLIY